MTTNRIQGILSRLLEFFDQQSIEAYLVGGFVRDTLLQRSTADVDIAVSADALTVGQNLAGVLKGKFVALDQPNGVARVVVPAVVTAASVNPEADAVVVADSAPLYIDLSTLQSNIEDDLERRDFSVDALAVRLRDYLENSAAPVPAYPVLDRHGGLQDLRKGLIRAVNDEVFQADPARLLRAFRLSAELAFTLDPATADLVKRDRAALGRVAGERVHEELIKLFSTSRAGPAVRRMDELGVLTVIIPELEASRDVQQPREHHWDVLNHSLECVATAGCVLRQGECAYVSPATLAQIPWPDSIAAHFSSPVISGVSHAVLLKVAALLHDIAKPETRIIAKERVRFFGHNEQGGDVVVPLLERLRFSHRETRLVECMVRNHMRPTQMSNAGMPTRRAIYRYYRDTGSAALDILFLSLADHLAARGPDLDPEQWNWHLEQVKYTLNEYPQSTVLSRTKRLVNGHDLITELGLAPGPLLRELLESAREAQAAGEITSRAEALSYIKNRLIYRKQNL